MADKKYIVSPILDFILLGGGSLFLFPLAMYWWPMEYSTHGHKIFVIFMTIAVFFIYAFNFPHFIYSYQMLYKDFFRKINGTMDKPLQIPYIWVGIIVPALLAVVTAYCYVRHDFILFGYLGNVGLLVTGWHFAKQGFGVLIVTSFYQKIYYTARERWILLWNANLFWVYSWVLMNTGMHKLNFMNAISYAVMFPPEIQRGLFYLVCLSTAGVVVVLIKKHIRESVFPPVAGIIGYVTAVYFWLVLVSRAPDHFHPVMLMIPAVHGIQYMTILFRMKHNEVNQNKMTKTSLAVFIVAGFVLSYLFFNTIPVMLDKAFISHALLNGGIMFVAIFAIFINIHHFFIDNVIWRKENSEVKNSLYAF